MSRLLPFQQCPGPGRQVHLFHWTIQGCRRKRKGAEDRHSHAVRHLSRLEALEFRNRAAFHGRPHPVVTRPSSSPRKSRLRKKLYPYREPASHFVARQGGFSAESARGRNRRDLEKRATAVRKQADCETCPEPLPAPGGLRAWSCAGRYRPVWSGSNLPAARAP